jgi:uncharacterized membrane protein
MVSITLTGSVTVAVAIFLVGAVCGAGLVWLRNRR